jgi:hypothetical protein
VHHGHGAGPAESCPGQYCCPGQDDGADDRHEQTYCRSERRAVDRNAQHGDASGRAAIRAPRTSGPNRDADADADAHGPATATQPLAVSDSSYASYSNAYSDPNPHADSNPDALAKTDPAAGPDASDSVFKSVVL